MEKKSHLKNVGAIRDPSMHSDSNGKRHYKNYIKRNEKSKTYKRCGHQN